MIQICEPVAGRHTAQLLVRVGAGVDEVLRLRLRDRDVGDVLQKYVPGLLNENN